MQVEMWSLDRIKPYEKNPRINDDAVDPVVQSINEFGFRQPIVVDPDGVIIVGHTRWKAASEVQKEFKIFFDAVNVGRHGRMSPDGNVPASGTVNLFIIPIRLSGVDCDDQQAQAAMTAPQPDHSCQY